jgi:CDP-diacylglycerol---glycerol-3-phosphate 3-phosphatidyltransferase
MATPLKFKTLPNAITALRIVAIPIVLYCIYTGAREQNSFWMTCGLVGLIFGEITDYADGTLARKTGEVSNVGKLIDPMSDSLFRMTVFMCFMHVGWADLWMLCCLFARDIIVAYLRVFTALQNVVLAARSSGKIKAIAQATAQIGIVLLALLHLQGWDSTYLGVDFASFDKPQTIFMSGIGWWFMVMATMVTIWSGVDYTKSVIEQVGIE